jgi:hypothetical protein
MSPMSLYTLDAETLKDLGQRDQHASPHGERGERWFTQAAMAVIGLALMAVILV